MAAAMGEAVEQVPELVRRLYQLVADFEALFPDRSFTPDGHLVGSIGEVIAAHRYRLTLHPASQATHDAIAPNGRHVQVKATQGKSVALRAEPEHLIVLHLGSDGESTEIYNGPGYLAWAECGKLQKNGQCSISLSKLRKIMRQIPPEQQIPRVK